MSLLDAMLLRGCRDTHEVWVSCVNNRTLQGTLIKANNAATRLAPNDSAARLVDTYFPAAEDAFVLAL